MANDKVTIWAGKLRLGRPPANGELLIGDGANFQLATLTNGAGITITNSAGGIQISYSGAGGTVTSVDASGGTTGLTFSGGPVTASGTLTMAGTLAVANGGTGQTSYTDGQLLIGNSSGNTLTKTTLTAGTGITITNGGGAITVAANNPWTRIDKTADQTITTSTSFVDDNVFQFAVTAGQRYAVRGLYSIYSDDVGGLKLAVNGPTLSTGELRAGTTSAAVVAYDTAFTSFGSAGAYVIAFYINFDCATTGTLALRIAQLNSAGNSTFEAGSWLEYTEIG